MSTLDQVSIRVASISGRIVLARFGKDPEVALETRGIQSEFWKALTQYAFDGKMPAPGEAVEIKYGAEDEQFLVRVERRQLDEEKK